MTCSGANGINHGYDLVRGEMEVMGAREKNVYVNISIQKK